MTATQTECPYKVGDRVEHGKLGHGTVIKAAAPGGVVKFDAADQEINFAHMDYLSPSDVPAPANDNGDHMERLKRFKQRYGGEIHAGGAFGPRLYRANVNGETVTIGIGDDGDAFTYTVKDGRKPLPDPALPVHATPFSLRDPATLPAREWLFARHYIRRYLTATVGAGGGGKSAHAVTEALAMVTGRPLLDPDGPLSKRLRVWYVNAEDPQDEIDRRFHAAAKHFGVTAEQIEDRLFTDSGREQEFVIMRQEGRDLKACQPLIDEMVAEIRQRRIDVVIIDPLVSTHEVPENDNGAMQRVAKAWTEVADRANCCVEVIHHIVKNAGEATADSARGGGALKDKTRGMRVINPMTASEAEKAGVDNAAGYFRIDHGKVNLVSSGRSQWRRFVNVPLGNGKGIVKTGDEIGVVEPWQWPSGDVVAERKAEARRAVVADVPAGLLAGIKVRLAASSYKVDPKGKPWAGDILIETGAARDKDHAKAMIAAWVEGGELEITEEIDPAIRQVRKFLRPAAMTENAS